jgi:hypothetical protein
MAAQAGQNVFKLDPSQALLLVSDDGAGAQDEWFSRGAPQMAR